MRSFWLFSFVLLGLCSGQRTPGNPEADDTNQHKEVICFVYHRVGDPRYPTTNISKPDFEAHLAYLVSNGFQVLSLSDAIDYMKSETPAKRTVVITIDDGFQSFFVNGLPLLKKYGLPATLFVNTETVGGADYMDWGALRKASENNIEIGNHTHSHAYFLNSAQATRYGSFDDEIALSQNLFEEHLSLTPRVFSYPYGEFDEKMEDIVKRAGFTGAVAQNSGVIYSGTNFFACPRFPMSEAYAAVDKFIEKASMHALEVIHSTPANFAFPGDNRPVLSIAIKSNDLRLEAIQCFVQGGGCDFRIAGKSQDTVTLTLQATQSIAGRRRTLYTLTVPDKAGGWHWYSHLWINPLVK